MGVRNACLRLPKDPGLRREAIETIEFKIEREKEAVREAKEEVDLPGAIKRVTDAYGVSKDVLAFVRKIKAKKPGDAAAMLAQLAVLANDAGLLAKDLVDLAQESEKYAGDGVDDQGSIFDRTTAAKRTGTDKAEPRHVEQPAPAPEPAPTPGLPREEYERRYKEAHDAWVAKGGRGRKPKALKEAEAALKSLDEPPVQAEADPDAIDDAREGDASDDDTVGEGTEDVLAAPEKPIHEQMREETAKGDAHIRQQLAAAPKPRRPRVVLVDDDDAGGGPTGDPLQGAVGQGSYSFSS
jgi:hypothetical protein